MTAEAKQIKPTKLAFTMPGKMGDALYTLPTIREMCEIEDCRADFYTSEYCRPLKNLFEYQSYIDRFIIPDDYKIERMDMGIQPWKIIVNLALYRTTYHLGFRGTPDKPLPDFIAHSVGFHINGGISYEYPDMETLDEPYIVLSPRGNSSYENLFKEFISICPHQVVVIGGQGDYIGSGIDKTGLDFLETLPWIAKSKGFVGLMSSQLVLANGFDITKVVPHDNKSWDMRHVLRSNYHHYLVNPTPKDIVNLL